MGSSKRHSLEIAGFVFLFLTIGVLIHMPVPAAGQFIIGTGIYDITGPVAECGMMGYSMPDKKTAGILP